MARILVVDDSATSRIGVRVALLTAGHEVVEAESGWRALEVVQEQAPFDLAIVDLGMPGMNGFELMSELRERLGTDGPRILVLTAESSRLLLGHAKASGARGWMSKPFETNQLLVAVDRVLA